MASRSCGFFIFIISNIVAFNQLLRFWRVFKYSYKKENSVVITTREKGTMLLFEPTYQIVPSFFISALLFIVVYLLFMWNVGTFFQNILMLDLISFI